jgi:4-amino-4-deoxy-L-arabinose transferase-like glycosyltransferase
MKLPQRVELIGIAVVAIATVLAFVSSINDAPIVDEVPHIGAGYSYLAKQDMRLNPEHPPLIKDLAGIALMPLLGFSNPAFATKPWTTDVNGQWQFGRSIIFDSAADPDLIKLVSRIPMLLVFVFACWLMWRWARERYGDTSALIATVLFAFSPTILAHGRFVTTDMGAAAGVLAATYCFIVLLRTQTRRAFLFAALSLGLALLAKFNTVLLGPFFILVAILYGLDGAWFSKKAWLRAGRMFLLTALVGITAFMGVVVPFYIFHTYNYPPARQLADTHDILRSYPPSILKTLVLWSADKPIARAAGQWALGLAMVQQRSAGGNTIFYMGNVVTAGGPGYFPTVYFLKEPLAWWILFSMALTALAFHHRRRPKEHKRGHFFTDNLEELAWILWLIIYWAISMSSTLNIGVRHLLPIYPFTILLVSGRIGVLIEWLRAHDRARLQWFSLAIAGLLGWYTFESVRVWPSYLSYFNQIAGGPSGGHRYVADSNLDWGQDIKRLGQWLERNNVQRVSIDYFGWSDPVHYLGGRYVYTTGSYWKDAQDFIKHNTSDGWIAVSATFFQEATNRAEPGKSTYRWLMDYKPVAVIGNSIFLWHITK